jgi:hypothetical protein
MSALGVYSRVRRAVLPEEFVRWRRNSGPAARLPRYPNYVGFPFHSDTVARLLKTAFFTALGEKH